MTTTTLHIEINSLPMNLRQEVAAFVESLKKKNANKPGSKSREFGYAKGKIKLSDDFDDPLEMFANYI